MTQTELPDPRQETQQFASVPKGERLQLLLNSALDAIITIDSQSRIHDWNKRAEVMFGWTEAEAVGRTITELIIPAQHRKAHIQGMRHFLSTGEGPILNRRIEITAVGRNEEEFPVELTVAPAEIGGQWIFTAFVRDITSQKEAENRLLLQHASTRILSQSRSLEEAAPALIEAVLEYTPWDLGAIWMTDRFSRTLSCAATHSLPYAELLEFEKMNRDTVYFPGMDFPGHIWETGKPAWARDVGPGAAFPQFGPASAAGLRTAFAFPIYLGNLVLGVFELFSRKALDEDPKMVEVLVSAGHQFGQFLGRRRVEDDLQRREEQLHLIMDSVPALISYVDVNQRYRFNNRAYENWLGQSREEVMGRHLREVLGEAAYAKIRPHAEAALSGQELAFEESVPFKEGQRFVRIHYIPHRRSDGKVEGYIALVVDLTERKRMEDALLQSQERLALIFNHVNDFLCLVGVEDFDTYRCLEVNEAYSSSTTLPRDSMVGRKLNEFLSAPVYSVWIQKAREVATTCKPILFEMESPTQVKKQILEHRWTPICDASGRCSHILMVVRDITDLRNREEELRQSQKMDAIGKLAGGIAHDFNNLLTVINGYSDLGATSFPENEPVRQLFEEIKQAGQRAADLTRHLLAFSRKQVLAPVALSLNSVVKEMDSMLRRVIGENIDLVTRMAPDLWVTRLDPGQLGQIILNLALNARDAMPEGGKLTLETANVELGNAYVSIHLEAKQGPHAMLAVSDTGTGMTPEVKARLFEPFFTTKEMGKGTGMGLASVYGIVKQSGGSIQVYSELGKGSTFRIYFPVTEHLSEINQAKTDWKPISRGKGEAILLVEDEDAVRKLTLNILERNGYIVLGARHGEEGIALAKETGTPIHLLITDMILTSIGGAQVAAALSEIHPETKVLYMSGYTDNAMVHQGILNRSAPFLQKPFSPEQLVRKVQEVLGYDAVPTESSPEAGASPAASKEEKDA